LKAKVKHLKVIIEGTRKSSRLLAKSKIKDMPSSIPLVTITDNDEDESSVSQVRTQERQFLGHWCKEASLQSERKECRVFRILLSRKMLAE
jgi:hypothetical protein